MWLKEACWGWWICPVVEGLKTVWWRWLGSRRDGPHAVPALLPALGVCLCLVWLIPVVCGFKGKGPGTGGLLSLRSDFESVPHG